MDTNRIRESYFEIGPIRPPSEGGSHSLLLRPTRNCPWNRCKFCYGMIYSREKFERRSITDIQKDIDAVKTIAEEIRAVSWEHGYGGEINTAVRNIILGSDSQLYSSQEFHMVFNWLRLGGKTAFLQDANTLVLPTDTLLEILTYLKEAFPSLNRITSYARSKTIVKKTSAELKRLFDAGLTRLHVGLETGDDGLLEYVDKGVTAQEHVEAGKKAKDAGFELSEYVMIDLGGRERSHPHAVNTARVLNEINPNYIRLRPFVIGPGLPLFEDYEKGILTLSSPHERLQELKTMVGLLNVSSRLCFDHFLNSWYKDKSRSRTLFTQDYEGYKLPEQKNEVLGLIETGMKTDESVHIHVKDLIGIRNL